MTVIPWTHMTTTTMTAGLRRFVSVNETDSERRYRFQFQFWILIPILIPILKSGTDSANYASAPAAVPAEQRLHKQLFGSKSLADRFPEFLKHFQECVQNCSSGYGLAAHDRRRDSDGILTGINLGRISEYILDKIPELKQRGIRLARSTVYSYLMPANKAVANRRGETGQFI